MNPLFRLSPLTFAISLALLPSAQAADYILDSGEDTFSSDRAYDGTVSLRPVTACPPA